MRERERERIRQTKMARNKYLSIINFNGKEKCSQPKPWRSSMGKKS